MVPGKALCKIELESSTGKKTAPSEIEVTIEKAEHSDD